MDYKISNAFVQWQPTQNLGFQAELGQRDDNIGDLTTEFGANTFSDTTREISESETHRVSMKYQSDSGTHFVLNVTDRNESNIADDTLALPNLTIDFANDEDIKSNQVELQLSHKFSFTTLRGGLRSSELNSAGTSSSYYKEFDYLDLTKTNSHKSIKQAYLYSDISTLSDSLLFTIGTEYNAAHHSIQLGEEQQIMSNDEDKKIYPKIGLIWKATPHLKVRTAFFESISMASQISWSLTPTHIAGFAQIFDQYNSGTKSSTKTIGSTFTVSNKSNVGFDILMQNLSVPFFNSLNTIKSDMQHNVATTYFDYLATKKMSAHFEFSMEEINRYLDTSNPFTLYPSSIRNNTLTIGLSYQLTGTAFLKLEGQSIGQQYSTESVPSLGIASEQFSEQMNILNASLEVDLPNMPGKIKLIGNNLLDAQFSFADLGLMYSAPSRQELSPERALSLNLEINL